MVKKIGWGLLKSKTVWGFGLAVVVGFAQTQGIVADANMVAQVVEAFGWLLGIVGARDVLNK